MANFIARRIFQNLITFLIIASLLFILFQLMPGDYASSILDPKLSPEARQRLREAFGLDKPLPIQYFSYLENIFTLDLGLSFTSGRKVTSIIAEKIGPTLLLFGSTLLFSFLLGALMGIILAWNYGSLLEQILTFQGLIFYTAFLPWIALLSLWIFSFQFHLFPLGGMISPEKWALEKLSLWGKTLDVLWHLALPLITLTLIRYSGTMLIIRGSMLDTLGAEYVTTARAKGLKERVVVIKHAVKNALLPMVTSFALSIPFVVSGGVITETVFSWPGLGWLLVKSTMSGDFPVVRTAFLLITILVLFMNLLADISYSFLDPRISYE